MKQNRYRTAHGIVMATDDNLKAYHAPKVTVCRQIINLSAATIAETFGVTGQAYIEGLRHAMIDHLSQDQVPVSSWREIAERVKGREAMDILD